jgi:hypothetical protein
MNQLFLTIILVGFLILMNLSSTSSQLSTVVPSNKPSLKPSRKPSNKPVHIYGDEKPIFLSENEQQGLVGALTILIFILMACEITGPEVLFLIALMICCLAQILTLPETLSGKHFCQNKN